MPYAMVPPGYRAVLLGSAARVEDLGTFAPLEESSAEGALFLMRLDFNEFPPAEALAQLEQALLDAGVEMWPGYSHVVYADIDQPGVYLAWQKGFAWMPIIIGTLVVTVLPALLGGVVWLLLPQSVKDMLTGIINLGMMMLVIWLMTSLMKPLTTPAREKPRMPKEPAPKAIEETKL
ncbi:MAG: hypothetical protein Q7J73_04000 [Dehalococcoidales bacterium]|nr:hypothetical protein [Dehalococcoidales bacterium]